MPALHPTLRRSIGLAIAALSVFAGLTGLFAPLGLDAPEQVALAILILAAALWISEAVPLFVTSLAILLLALVWLVPVLADADMPANNADYTAPFFSDVILLFLGGFTLSAALRKHRFDEQLAKAVLRATGGELPKLIAGVMGVTAVLSMWISNTATAAMMLALCLPLVRHLPDHHTGRRSLILAIPLAANIGGIGTPIGTPPNAIAIRYLQERGESIDFFTWMLASMPAVLAMLVLAWIGLFLAAGKQRGHVLEISPEEAAPSASPFAERAWRPILVIVVTACTVLGWVTDGLHPFTPGTVALLPVVVFFGAGALDTGDLRAMAWDVLLLMGGGLCLGEIMQRSGLAATMLDALPLDNAPTIAVLAAIAVTACLMSTFMSNTASATLLLPLVMGLSALDPSPLALSVAIACSLAMALPISTPPNAIAFSSGEIRAKDLLLFGGAASIIGLALLITLGPWWWSVIGL
ncbi:MAG: SLC13/DASS family transporter [Phycisphaerales bacterium]|nr:MAG: SLC13/DASS family transporter [Phycisphaerales bacterium]